MSAVSPAYRYRAEVVRVIDGDTLEADVDLGFFTWVRRVGLRLRDVDCPERFTEAGKAATAFTLARMAECGGRVVIDSVKPDKYGGRWDVYVWLPDGSSLGHRLTEAGHVKPPAVTMGAD